MPYKESRICLFTRLFAYGLLVLEARVSLPLLRRPRPYVESWRGSRKVRPSAISWLLYAIKSQPSINLTVLASCRYKWFLLQRDGPFIRSHLLLSMPFFHSFSRSLLGSGFHGVANLVAFFDETAQLFLKRQIL